MPIYIAACERELASLTSYLPAAAGCCLYGEGGVDDRRGGGVGVEMAPVLLPLRLLDGSVKG